MPQWLTVPSISSRSAHPTLNLLAVRTNLMSNNFYNYSLKVWELLDDSTIPRLKQLHDDHYHRHQVKRLIERSKDLHTIDFDSCGLSTFSDIDVGEPKTPEPIEFPRLIPSAGGCQTIVSLFEWWTFCCVVPNTRNTVWTTANWEATRSLILNQEYKFLDHNRLAS